MARKTAMSKDPKAAQNKPKPTQNKPKPSPANPDARQAYLDTVRNLGNLPQGSPEYTQAVAKVRQLGQQLGYNTARIDTAINKYSGPNQQQQINQGTANLVQQGLEQATQFDPTKFQQQYEPGFQQGLQKEYERIYGAFERQNADRFGREQQQLQQSLVERGLDPAGEASKALNKNLYEQQQIARQNAQDTAMTQAFGAQNQFYQQAAGSALLPSQMATPYLSLYGQQQQMGFEAQQAELERKNREKLARMGGGGGGTNNNEALWAQYVMNQYGQQGQKQPSALNSGASTFGAALGAGITRRLTQG